MKKWMQAILFVLFPLGILYLLLLRCEKRPWPQGLKAYDYAHRGLHHLPDAPENSLAAFRAAAEQGYGAELDVHLMRDGKLAVIHDSSLLRTAGVDVPIESLSAEDLQAYSLEGSQERIPLLEEVLAIFAGRAPLIVELKVVGGNYKKLTAAVCEMLDQFEVTCCLESFDPRVLLWLKKHRPELIRGQLSGNLLREGEHNPLILFGLTHLLSNAWTKPDFIAYDYHYRERCPGLKICRKLYGVQEVSWTVREAKSLDNLKKKGNLVIFEGFAPLPKKDL